MDEVVLILKIRVVSECATAVRTRELIKRTFIKSNDAETTISDRLANQIRIVRFSTVNAKVNRRLASSRIVWCMLQIAF